MCVYRYMTLLYYLLLDIAYCSSHSFYRQIAGSGMFVQLSDRRVCRLMMKGGRVKGQQNTVKPLNSRHIGGRTLVCYREIALI